MTARVSNTAAPALPDSSKIKHIGVMMLAEIGDILVATPTISALKGLYPDARITAIVRAAFAELLIGNPGIDNLILLDRKNIWTKLKFLSSLFLQRFDLFVDLHTPTFNTCSDNRDVFRRNSHVMLFTRATYRLGYASDHTRSLLTHTVAIPPDAQLARENIVDTTLRIVGCENRKQFPKVLKVQNDAVSWASGFLGSAIPNGKYVVLFFGSKQPADVWPLQKVAGFIQGFLSAFREYHLMLVGGAHEIAAAGSLVRSTSTDLQPRLINLVGETSLQQTAACIMQSCCMISTDSGPLHMADALQVPLVALFSSKNYPAVWRPVNSRTVLLNKAVSCGPCFREICDQNNACMERISVDEVLTSVRMLLPSSP